MENVAVSFINTNLMQLTNSDGIFSFDKIPISNLSLHIKAQGYKEKFIPLKINADKMIDLGIIFLEYDISSEQQLSLVSIMENDLGDDNSGSETTAGLLQATRDVFQQAAAFNWGQARFRIRGLDNAYSITMINGAPMNKLYDGRPQWSNWGGLNDATRNQEFTTGSAPSDYTFGNILGTQEINTRASMYRRGTRISFSGTNTNYSWRMMATHASGLSNNGWAYVVSASRRWSEEGYFEGTSYDANSFFTSIEKRINDKHGINLTFIYARNSRGKNSPNTAEATAIAGQQYNSYWGWDQGKKRNSRIKDVEEPISMLSHYWKINSRNILQTNLMYQSGTVGNTRLDFQDVNSPDPTYYKNMPSYYLSQYQNDEAQVPAQAYEPGGLGSAFAPDLMGAMSANFMRQQQIDWSVMYNANRSTYAGNSVYVLYEDRTDDDTVTANSLLNSQLTDNIGFNGGLIFRKLKSHNFQNLLDLLGGSFFGDIDSFGQGDQTQTDLNNPDRQVFKGQSFGYNYKLFANTFDAFTQFKFTYKKIDFYLSQSYSRSDYQREGLYRNGYYPTNSLGKSGHALFENFGFKGGMTLKFSGQSYLDMNAIYLTKAPALRDVFPNSRMNNNSVNGINNEKIENLDVSYLVRMPKFKARLTGYFAKIQQAAETSFYYAEGIFQDTDGTGGVQGNAFVAETLKDVDKKYIGLEAGLEYQLSPTFKFAGSIAFGKYTYGNNQEVLISQDALATTANNSPVTNFGHALIKNYNLPGMPQQAYSFGAEYRDPKFWWIGANINYLSNNYLDVAPLLRTTNFLSNTLDIDGFPYPELDTNREKVLLKQEKFNSLFLLNLSGGKSWSSSGKTFGFFASINNLLDTGYKTGGFEQARKANYRKLNQDISSGNPAFAPKYFYGYGRTFFANFYINF